MYDILYEFFKLISLGTFRSVFTVQFCLYRITIIYFDD